MEKVGDWINTLIYLIPLVTLIWKAATMAAQIKRNEEEIMRLREQVDEEKHATDSVIVTLTGMLNDIKIAVTRIETKLEVRDDVEK